MTTPRIYKTNIMQNVFTVMAMNTVLCCMLVLFRTKHIDAENTYLDFTVMTIDAVVFLSWLVWFSYIVWRPRKLKPMDPKAYRVLERLDFILFAYWILVRFVPAATGPWIVPVVGVVWVVSTVYALRHASPADTSIAEGSSEN